MTHLTKPTVYDIKDSNIALLGSDIEKHVREIAGEGEPAWHEAGKAVGLEVWRIEHFHVVPWPKDKFGTFYDGDSYIVLNTYKKTPDAKAFSYDLHFWLGRDTTQDEAGTAAYKTVELDDFLFGKPVQFREVQGSESARFLSYFPKFLSLQGGISTGFHHVSVPPPLNVHKLYRITFSRPISHQPSAGHIHAQSLVVREVVATADSLVEGDVYVLDKGAHVLQLNTLRSVGQERFKAAEFVQELVNERENRCEVTVYDEGDSGAGRFLVEFGEGTTLRKAEVTADSLAKVYPLLFRISDASGGEVSFASIHPSTPLKGSLSSSDAFLLDCSFGSLHCHPAIFVWIGKYASLNERRLSLQYAQKYLYTTLPNAVSSGHVSIPVIKLLEGEETFDFLQVVSAAS